MSGAEGAESRLVIESIPDEDARRKLAAFLARICKGKTEDDIAKLLSTLPASISANIPLETGQLLAKQIEKTGARVRFVPALKRQPQPDRAVPVKPPVVSGAGRDQAEGEAFPSSLPQTNVNRAAAFTPTARKSRLPLLVIALCTLLTLVVVFFGYQMFVSHVLKADGGKYAARQARKAHYLKRAADAPKAPLPRELQVETRGYAETNGVRYALIEMDSKWVELLYSKKDFDAVERRLSSLLNAKDDPVQMFELYMLYRSLGNIHSKENTVHMKEVLNEWCSSHAGSHFPWIVRGYFDIQYAWRARGGALAKDVPKDAWAVFDKWLENAQSDLEKSYQLNPNDPNSSCFLLIVSKGQSFPREEMEQYFNNAVAACPTHYGAHIYKADYLKPKWHGSEEELFEFAEECLAHAGKDPAMGFPLVEAYSDLHDRRKDKENVLGANATWPIIQGIYEDFFEKYPNDIRRRFFYSYYAYKAGKYDIAYDQFEVAGDRWLDGVPWSSLEGYNRCRAFVHYFKGQSVARAGDYAAAEAFCNSSLKFNQTARAYYLLSVCHLQEPDKSASTLQKAEAALVKAVELDPKDQHFSAQLKMVRGLLQANRASGGTESGKGKPN